MFWSKQRKSIWISAWNLTFSFFISPILQQYESVNFKELHKSHTKAKDTIDQKQKKKKGRTRCNVNYTKHQHVYKNQHRGICLPILVIVFVSLFIWKFLFFVSMKCWGRFPFTNFICRFIDTIDTKDYKLNFNRSVMLRGGH